MRADFYVISKPRFLGEPLRLVCELAKKAEAAGEPTAILVRSIEQAESLDDLLWSFDPDAYIPHQIAGRDDEDGITPVLIVPPGVSIDARPLLINLRDDVPNTTFTRVLEVVPADPAAREPLRQRWREYQARGCELMKHEM